MQRRDGARRDAPGAGSVSPDLSLAGLAERLSTSGTRPRFRWWMTKRLLIGVVSADDLEPALSDVGGPDTARALARPVPELRADGALENAARLLGDSEEAGLPVLAAEGRTVVGWITHRDVLRAYLRGSQARGGGGGRGRPRKRPEVRQPERA